MPQRIDRVKICGADGRRHAEHDADRNTNRERHANDRRRYDRLERGKPSDQPAYRHRYGDSNYAADNGEHHGFRQELNEDVRAPRPYRFADPDLPRALRYGD